MAGVHLIDLNNLEGVVVVVLLEEVGEEVVLYCCWQVGI